MKDDVEETSTYFISLFESDVYGCINKMIQKEVPETFFAEWVESIVKKSNTEITEYVDEYHSSIQLLLSFFITQNQYQGKFEEDDNFHISIQDTILQLYKIHQISSTHGAFFLEAFVHLYKKQLFHVYENHKKYKQRFIDSIVDFCIQRNIIEWILVLQKEGYEPKKELYLYSMYHFPEDTERLQKLKTVNVPFDKVLCEYAGRYGFVKALEYFHKERCEWDSLTLYSSCLYLQESCIDYALENGCPWDNQILLSLGGYFSKENENKPNYQEKKDIALRILQKLQKYIQPKPISSNENEDLKKTTE
jgi:hypothetical protein